jgi:5'-3' exonuclease
MGKRPPKDGTIRQADKNILLVDGNSLFKVSYHGAKNMYNQNGDHIGGIYQFLTQLRKTLSEGLYHQVFTFWDGNKGGKLRWNVYKDYKANRNKDFINGSVPVEDDEIEQEEQKAAIRDYLEELFIRQFSHPEVESDDFIAYFCKQKKDNEKITIITGDADICQLIDDDVRVFYLKTGVKTYVTKENFTKHFDYPLENLLVHKILLGDKSDFIKGVKGLGDKTFKEHFPEFFEKPMTLEDVIDKAKRLNQERIDGKLKPLKVFDNIINGVTNGCQGDKLYEINEQIINLKKPLLTSESLEDVNVLIDGEIDPEGRSVKNVYNFLKRDGIDKVLGEDRFTNYLFPFKKLMEREIKSIII